MRNPFKRKNKKYYLVSYSFENGSGFMTMHTENMDYLNREKSVKIIDPDGSLPGNIVITNIIKLSKKEYDCWIA